MEAKSIAAVITDASTTASKNKMNITGQEIQKLLQVAQHKRLQGKLKYLR